MATRSPPPRPSQAAPLAPPADIPIVEPAPRPQRVAPPPPGPEIVPAVPTPVIQRLANGLTVITVAEPLVPLVTRLAGRRAAAPPTIRAGRAGTAALAAAVMTEGTRDPLGEPRSTPRSRRSAPRSAAAPAGTAPSSASPSAPPMPAPRSR